MWGTVHKAQVVTTLSMLLSSNEINSAQPSMNVVSGDGSNPEISRTRPFDMSLPTEPPMKSRGERLLDSLRKPKLRLVRVFTGVLLILGGLVGFLPFVGFWMVPLGLAVLAIDFPIADRLLRKLRSAYCKLRRYYLRCSGPPCSGK